MLKKIFLAISMMALTNNSLAAMGDDPLLVMGKIDLLEIQQGDNEDPFVFEGFAWIGKDLNKLWINSEVEKNDGEIEENELQILYGRAFAPYWDFMIGLRRDFKPEPEQDWLAVGVQGLAPYYFELDAMAYFSEDNNTNFRLTAEYELMFTQRLFLSPEFEINLYSDSDEERGIGSGLSDASLGLRIGYEVRREFSPYIGVTTSQLFGDTKDLSENEGEGGSDTRFVAGIRAWF